MWSDTDYIHVFHWIIFLNANVNKIYHCSYYIYGDFMKSKISYSLLHIEVKYLAYINSQHAAKKSSGVAF